MFPDGKPHPTTAAVGPKDQGESGGGITFNQAANDCICFDPIALKGF